MRYFIPLMLILTISSYAFGQKFQSTSSNVRFFSSAPMEDIEATTTSSQSVIDMTTGEFAFVVKMKDFKFEQSLMQEHFNENYIESEKYPEATFAGTIENWSKSIGKQDVIAKGNLKVHGLTREVEIKGTINYQTEKVTIQSVFPIKLVDHKIKIPKAVFYNIAEEVEVTISYNYALFKN